MSADAPPPSAEPALRHGIDLVHVPRLRAAMEAHARFEEEVFTDGERAYCRRRPDPFPHFAARFAAKEAVLKALGRGLFGEGVDRSLKEIEVVRDGSGPPTLRLSGASQRRAERLGLGVPALSLTHDGESAVASIVWMAAR
jgi:holo-[acyl-carrier protein] synthase